jgi:hypothetical protein
LIVLLPIDLASRSSLTAQPSGTMITTEPPPAMTSISISWAEAVACRQLSFTEPTPELIRRNGGTTQIPSRFSLLTPPSRRSGSSREYPGAGGPGTDS